MKFGAKSTGAKKQTFIGKAAAAEDPLKDVPLTDSLEVDAAAELDAMTVAYRGRKTAEDARFNLATDTEYWLAICFETREQKEAFLRASRTAALGDKYIDGKRFAAMLKISLPD